MHMHMHTYLYKHPFAHKYISRMFPTDFDAYSQTSMTLEIFLYLCVFYFLLYV